ncbi:MULTISPECIES: transposase [Streptomyces]
MGKPAWSPARLALMSVMQFAEGLSDRQAADAVRGRLDWKYLLGLELELADPGFDHSVLTEFRDRLIAGDAGIKLLDRVPSRPPRSTACPRQVAVLVRTPRSCCLPRGRSTGWCDLVRPCGPR